MRGGLLPAGSGEIYMQFLHAGAGIVPGPTWPVRVQEPGGLRPGLAPRGTEQCIFGIVCCMCSRPRQEYFGYLLRSLHRLLAWQTCRWQRRASLRGMPKGDVSGLQQADRLQVLPPRTLQLCDGSHTGRPLRVLPRRQIQQQRGGGSLQSLHWRDVWQRARVERRGHALPALRCCLTT